MARVNQRDCHSIVILCKKSRRCNYEKSICKWHYSKNIAAYRQRTSWQASESAVHRDGELWDTKVNRGERTKYLVSNNHPAIVDRDLFNSVQAEIARRSSKRRTSDKTLTPLGKYSGKYALSELLICAECGNPYKRKTWTNGNEKRIY